MEPPSYYLHNLPNQFANIIRATRRQMKHLYESKWRILTCGWLVIENIAVSATDRKKKHFKWVYSSRFGIGKYLFLEKSGYRDVLKAWRWLANFLPKASHRQCYKFLGNGHLSVVPWTSCVKGIGRIIFTYHHIHTSSTLRFLSCQFFFCNSLNSSKFYDHHFEAHKLHFRHSASGRESWWPTKKRDPHLSSNKKQFPNFCIHISKTTRRNFLQTQPN